MSEQMRITLDWIEILDSHDIDTVGEFRFRFRVSCEERGLLQETHFPETGHLEISENPTKNRVLTDIVLYEGPMEGKLVVEAYGEELDRFSANDELTPYRRVIDGSSPAWQGRYEPWDEANDPEAMKDWRLSYTVEALTAARPST